MDKNPLTFEKLNYNILYNPYQYTPTNCERYYTAQKFSTLNEFAFRQELMYKKC